jgi:single-strand DNA-binding protein
MSNLNKVMLIGRVGKAPEVRKFENGQLAQFSLATTSKWKNKSGEIQERTEWHNITINGKLSEVVEKYVVKGMLIFIEGEIRYEEYEKEGQKRQATKIYAYEMKMLSEKGKDGQETAKKGQENVDSDDGDLPWD